MALDYLRTYARPRTGPSVDTDIPVVRGGRIELAELLDGELVTSTNGSCFVASSVRTGDTLHGRHRFGDLEKMVFDKIGDLNREPELAFADMRQAVFLDTETTGLGMGTGTYVFLVGAGYFDGRDFHVRQFFLRDPGEEEPFLEELQRFLSRFSLLVTFNGKAFDWPLLENRYLGHRTFRKPPLDDPLHVDLLHPARRLWKRRLESCALSSLEKHVLGVERTGDDVPGWMIPSLYFRYVHSGDARPLEGVFYHNLIDILSLASLAIHMDQVLSDPLGALVEHPIDLLCLGKHFDREGQHDTAVSCLEAALDRGLLAEPRTEALERLALLHKRERRWDRAFPMWDALIEDGGTGALTGLMERAKYQEHVARDYFEALDDVQQAIILLELDGTLSRIVERGDLEHRRTRLMDRVLRERRWGTR